MKKYFRLIFSVYIVYEGDVVSLYTLSNREAESWVKRKGKNFKLKRILITRFIKINKKDARDFKK